LLSGCPRLRVLATSREALRVPGEIAWRVPSLSAPDPSTLDPSGQDLASLLLAYDAVRLLTERAPPRPEFPLTRENARAAAEVCWRLDGIPLAIELAAARLQVLSLSDLAARLGDRFRLLTH